MAYYKRYLHINLPERQSAFLWGARKTGKSSFLKKSFPEAIYYDLLKADLFLSLSNAPNILREELENTASNTSDLVIIDEVQKIPALLDEIHWLIENTSLRFILCGSSAKKLKRYGVNMLGGRAWKYHFFPLAYPELPEFDLLKIFQRGTIPAHYDSPAPNKALKAYWEDYIALEIQAEGLVRNLSAFIRFADAIRFSHAEMLNYSNIASEAHIDSKTVSAYFSILVDTLMGYLIYPFKKHVGRQIISETPKFYLFDVGVANYLQRNHFTELKGQQAGKALEHYILLELIAYKELNEKDFEINYWRTKTGLEVDFILGSGEIALEVKLEQQPDKSDLRGLTAFCEEHNPKSAYLICMVPRARRVKRDGLTIDILPVKTFLEQLWQGKII